MLFVYPDSGRMRVRFTEYKKKKEIFKFWFSLVTVSHGAEFATAMSTRAARNSRSKRRLSLTPSQSDMPQDKENAQSAVNGGTKPNVATKSNNKPRSSRSRAPKAYCLCRKPDDKSPMILCSQCNEWCAHWFFIVDTRLMSFVTGIISGVLILRRRMQQRYVSSHSLRSYRPLELTLISPRCLRLSSLLRKDWPAHSQ